MPETQLIRSAGQAFAVPKATDSRATDLTAMDSRAKDERAMDSRATDARATDARATDAKAMMISTTVSCSPGSTKFGFTTYHLSIIFLQNSSSEI